jgi:Hemerythrin HHE cation binding domain
VEEATVDVLEELKQAHSQVKAMFAQIEGAAPDQRGPLWARLRPELTTHEQYEEQFVYGPVAKDAEGRDPMLVHWCDRHRGQAEVLSSLIDDIGRVEAASPEFLPKLRELQSALEQHIAQEEQEIFPQIARVWDADRRNRAGDQVAAAKGAAGAAAGVSQAASQVTDTLKRAADELTGR